MNAQEIMEWSKGIWGWMDGAVGGWRTYTDDERFHLAETALQVVPEGGLIFEIGSFAGLSTSVLLQVARTKKAKIGIADMFIWETGLEHGEPERRLREVLCQFPDVEWRMYATSSKLAHMVATTRPCSEGGVTCPPLVDHNINYLHIDGDHLAAREDCKLWVPHMVSGGAVAFHDANPNPQAPIGCMVVADANEFTGDWTTMHHSLNENCLLVRRKPFDD